MLKTRSHLPSYSDGVAVFYRPPETVNSYGARENPAISDMDVAATLAFREQVVREQDFTFAEQRGFNASRKISTHLAPGPDAGCKCAIDGLLYDVSYIERTRADMYVYLEGGYPYGNA